MAVCIEGSDFKRAGVRRGAELPKGSWMKRTSCFASFLGLGILFASSEALAIKIKTETANVNADIKVLVQPRVEVDAEGPTTGSGVVQSPSGKPYTDFYLRRIRLIASGTAFKYLAFNIMLDTPNFSKRGNTSIDTFTQDVAVGFQPVENMTIEAGFLYVPFTHAMLGASGAASAMEKPGISSLYNAGAANGQRGLRETGVQFRGLFFDKLLLVRGGAYEGIRSTSAMGAQVNPDNVPMFAGTLRLNLIGDEPGYSYPGIYYDGKSRLSVGIAGHYQEQSGGLKYPGALSFSAYAGMGADVFADIALPDDMEVVGEIGVFRFDHDSARRADLGARSNAKTGNGAYLEAGFRIGVIEPQVNAFWFNSDSKKASSIKAAAGLNYFLDKHAAKLSIEGATFKTNTDIVHSADEGGTPWAYSLIVQAQAYL